MIFALVYLNNVDKVYNRKTNKQIELEKGNYWYLKCMIIVILNILLVFCAGMPVIEGKWAFNLWFVKPSRNVLYNYPK